MQVTQRGTERVCFASPETDWRQLYSSVLTQSMTGDWRIQVDVSTDTVLAGVVLGASPAQQGLIPENNVVMFSELLNNKNHRLKTLAPGESP